METTLRCYLLEYQDTNMPEPAYFAVDDEGYRTGLQGKLECVLAYWKDHDTELLEATDGVLARARSHYAPARFLCKAAIRTTRP